jgi:hypothetical protein
MKKLLFLVTIFSVMALSSKAQTTDSKNKKISYVVAKNYFVKNSAETLLQPQIESQEQFDAIFGMAAFQGENGKPTAIDFSKQFVIAIIKPETNISTTLNAISLTKNKSKKLEFTYSVKKGDEQQYTIVPSLIIIVEKKYFADVKLIEKK